MKLRTSIGEEIVLGSGCVILLDKRSRHILLSSSEDVSIKWPICGDDKLVVPKCIKTENDFTEIIDFVVRTHGLDFKKSKHPFISGVTLYRLIESKPYYRY